MAPLPVKGGMQRNNAGRLLSYLCSKKREEEGLQEKTIFLDILGIRN